MDCEASIKTKLGKKCDLVPTWEGSYQNKTWEKMGFGLNYRGKVPK